MKHRKNELDVDFIGDQDNPITEEEMKALDDYFKHIDLTTF